MEQRVIISTQLESELVSALSECEHDKLFVLTDTTTLELCIPVLQSFYCMKEAHIITIPATDSHKTSKSDDGMERTAGGRSFTPLLYD